MKYLKERIEQYELKKWHVIFDSNIKDGRNGFHNSCGVQIRRVGRNVSTKTGEGGEIDLKKTIFRLRKAMCLKPLLKITYICS